MTSFIVNKYLPLKMMPVCPILAFTTPGEIDVWGIIGGPIETGVSGEEEER